MGDITAEKSLEEAARYLLEHAKPYGIGNALDNNYRYEVRERSITRLQAAIDAIDKTNKEQGKQK